MKTKPPSPTALKVPEWLLKEAEGYVEMSQGSKTRHAVLLAMIELGARALREDASLLEGAIGRTKKSKGVPESTSADVSVKPVESTSDPDGDLLRGAGW
jgi:hypothetical protein